MTTTPPWYYKTIRSLNKSTTAEKWSCKEFSKWEIYTLVVRNGNIILTYIFGNHCDAWAHPIIYFIILLLSTFLVLSISPAFAVTKHPTPIFIFTRFASSLSLIIVITGQLIVDLGEGGGGYQLQLISASALLIFCVWKVIPTKTEANKKHQVFEK